MNRFDNGSISAYTPQSFQELSFVPMIKRQQHDEMSKNLAELDAIAVDPLDKHRDEALKLKLDIENKLGNLSGELASKGIDGLGKEAFYKLKKERDALVAPTGKIGQINAAKIDYNKQQEDFIKNAEAQKIGRDIALQLWDEKTKDYSGYDDKGNILNVRPQGVAAYQDYEDDLLKYHSILGKTTTSAKSSGYSIVDSGQGDGSKIMIDKTGNIVHSDNIQQLNDAIKGFSTKWINPNGEGAKYAKDAGLNVTPEKVFNDFKAMTEKSDIDNRGQQTQYIPGRSGSGDGENPNNPNNIDSIPEAVSTINSNEELLNGLMKYNENLKNGVKFDTRGNSTYDIHLGSKPKDFTSIDNPEYKDLAQKIINQSPSLKGLKTNDPKVVNATINYLNTHKNTQTVNRIITPTTSKDTRGYSADEISKYTKMKQDAMETSIRNGMKVFDSEGNLIEKPKSKSIIYNGEYTFNSVVPIKHTNSKTKFAPIAATMVDEDGNEQKVYVEQNPDREKDPLFKAQYTAFQTLNKANKYRGLKQPLKNTFTEENLGLRDVDVTYNDDGSIILEGKHYNGKNWEKMPKQIYGNDSDFVNYIHNLYN
jgi:hypothetical protein